MDDMISKLSEIRSDYNCFDKDEEPQYRALSEAIRILSQRADGDTISRKAAIDCVTVGAKPTTIKGRIAELPSAQPEQRWIPSGERPPEEGSYLVWMPFAPPEERIAVEYYCDGYWNIKTPISAWMPLPEPYRGGEE